MPKLEATYEPMIVKEARYIAITMMKVTGTLDVYIIRGVTVHVFEVHAARQRIHLQSVKGLRGKSDEMRENAARLSLISLYFSASTS